MGSRGFHPLSCKCNEAPVRFDGEFEVVPTTRLEPVLMGFPSLPVAASCVVFMPLQIRYAINVCRLFIASTGCRRKENLCDTVRACGGCAELCGTQNLCKSVRTAKALWKYFSRANPSGCLQLFVRIFDE